MKRALIIILSFLLFGCTAGYTMDSNGNWYNKEGTAFVDLHNENNVKEVIVHSDGTCSKVYYEYKEKR